MPSVQAPQQTELKHSDVCAGQKKTEENQTKHEGKKPLSSWIPPIDPLGDFPEDFKLPEAECSEDLPTLSLNQIHAHRNHRKQIAAGPLDSMSQVNNCMHPMGHFNAHHDLRRHDISRLPRQNISDSGQLKKLFDRSMQFNMQFDTAPTRDIQIDRPPFEPIQGGKSTIDLTTASRKLEGLQHEIYTLAHASGGVRPQQSLATRLMHACHELMFQIRTTKADLATYTDINWSRSKDDQITINSDFGLWITSLTQLISAVRRGIDVLDAPNGGMRSAEVNPKIASMTSLTRRLVQHNTEMRQRLVFKNL